MRSLPKMTVTHTQPHQTCWRQVELMPSLSPEARPIWNDGQLRAYIAQDYGKTRAEALIEDFLPQRGHAMISAKSGSLKSFLAVDVACHVDTGMTFHGRRVSQGKVVYVAGEAAEEIGERVRVWSRFNHRDSGVILVPQALQIPDERDMLRLTNLVREQDGIKLIIIDTLSRSMMGVKDNESEEVNLKVNKPLADLVTATGATVLVVHHTGWDGKRERGSTALRDAVDASILVTRSSQGIRISCEKMRRAAAFKPFALVPQRFAGSLVLATAAAEPSLDQATSESEESDDGNVRRASKRLRQGRARITNADRLYAVLVRHPQGISRPAFREQVEMGDSSYYDGLKRLFRDGRVREKGGLLFASEDSNSNSKKVLRNLQKEVGIGTPRP